MVAGQVDLDLRPAPVTVETIRSKRSMSEAIRLCVEVSTVGEKTIRMRVGIEAAQWSRIKQGDTHFPHDKLEKLMQVAGNDIPLQWLAWRRGFGLVLLEDEKDRRIRELEGRLAQEQAEREAITKFVREIRP